MDTTASPTRFHPFPAASLNCPGQPKEAFLRRTLRAAGYTEAISSTFCSAADAKLVCATTQLDRAARQPSQRRSRLSYVPSLVPGMLSMLAHNLNREVDDLRLFEMGTIFSGKLGASAGKAFTCRRRNRNCDHAARPRQPARLQLLRSQGHRGRNALRVCHQVHRTWTHSRHRAASCRHGCIPAARRVSSWTAKPSASSANSLRTNLNRENFAKPSSLANSIWRASFSTLFASLPPGSYLAFPPSCATSRSHFPMPSVGSKLPRLLAVARHSRRCEAPNLGRFFETKKNTSGSYALLLRVVFQAPDRTLRLEELQDWARRIFAALMGLGGQPRFPLELAFMRNRISRTRPLHFAEQQEIDPSFPQERL